MFFVSQTDGDFKPCSLEFLFQNMYNLLSWKLEDQDPDPPPFSFFGTNEQNSLQKGPVIGETWRTANPNPKDTHLPHYTAWVVDNTT
jgi:hypothetical protein